MYYSLSNISKSEHVEYESWKLKHKNNESPAIQFWPWWWRQKSSKYCLWVPLRAWIEVLFVRRCCSLVKIGKGTIPSFPQLTSLDFCSYLSIYWQKFRYLSFDRTASAHLFCYEVSCSFSRHKLHHNQISPDIYNIFKMLSKFWFPVPKLMPSTVIALLI